MSPQPGLFIGTAGWGIPAAHSASFPSGPSHLHRYAQTLPAAEINTSFYRPHRPATYARWADSVPLDFRFAVKLPQEITHQRRMVDVAAPLDRFLAETAALGDRRGPLLAQFPPSLALDPAVADAFFALLRQRLSGPVVCEPRHPTWFTPSADALLARHHIARVAADPAPVPAAAAPGGWSGLAYLRLHGTPRIYYSEYSPAALDAVATNIRALLAAGRPVWCIFDNTALGAAAGNAVALAQLMGVEWPQA